MPTAPRRLSSCKVRGTAPCLELFEVTCPLPKGSDGDEPPRLSVQHVSEAVTEAVRASILHYLQCWLQHVLICADRDTNHRDPTIVCNADNNAFQDTSTLGRRVVPLRG